jgi:hypothetical protein
MLLLKGKINHAEINVKQIAMRTIFTSACLLMATVFISCGNANTPEALAKKWCELNAKVHNAASDEEKDKARDEREKFEDELESKYKNDEAFMKKLEEEVEKCEDASEGR